MSPGSIPSALSLSGPFFSIAWDRFIAVLRAAAAELREARQRAAELHAEWRQWQSIRHLSPHLLRDIGAQQLHSWADVEQVRDEWRARASATHLG